MPTYYAPTKRTKRKGGKVYTNRTYVVRGRINGREYEIHTRSTHKKGAGGAEEKSGRTSNSEYGQNVTPFRRPNQRHSGTP